MEKPIRRAKSIGLTALFWRYLLTTGAITAAIMLIWWMLLMMVMRSGFVLPANTASSQAQRVAQALSQAEITLDDIPHYLRWIRLDEAGQAVDSSGMDDRHLDAALQAAQTGGVIHSFPYDQYHQLVELPDGGTCVLQYDYSAPYWSAAAQEKLPDFQNSMIVLLVAVWIPFAFFRTRRYTRILKKDAAALTAASQAIAAQRLDAPFQADVRVRELREALDTMDRLRQNLARSLQEQWAMEQQRRQEIAALTHDLKTPLTIINGNSELLAEDNLPPEQRKIVEAILRSTQHLEGYIEQLRLFSTQSERIPLDWETVALEELFVKWRNFGEGLCTPKNIRFTAQEPPGLTCTMQKEAVSRAVLNLLDNAVRYASDAGEVCLFSQVDGEILTICVTDTGSGFSPEALAQAGRAFYTSDSSRPMDGHMGMGLYFVRQVAQNHGGELLVSNTEQGAKVELILKINR